MHADISSMGEIWQRLNASLGSSTTPAEDYFGKSKEVEEAMIAAARFATETVLLRDMRKRNSIMMPARPIVLGGDDLTIIVRADLAIDFAQAFLEKLEKREVDGRPLTACAGIAFIKANQPFYMASGLAEDLCKFAKSAVKRRAAGVQPPSVPSALAFHRITSSLIDDYDSILTSTRTKDIEGSQGEPHRKYLSVVRDFETIERLI